MRDFLVVGINEVREHRDDGPTIVMRQHGHFTVHFRTLAFVQLGLGGTQQFIEPRVLPLALVPGRIVLVCQRVHDVRRRA